MPLDFWSPSMRASSGDLTVSVSPLGLVELADEEFEVHGPRLNRYSAAWAFYLGHHWSYRREQGEQNITMNYVRAMSDYITNFCFGKGIQFKVPEQNGAITPYLLHKVWETHNNKHFTLWEMGQLASVTGDCFVKVAYEEPYQDSLGIVNEGRIRIIPMNSSHCFPEYHPHDRDRLLRFKQKYRFWGTSPEGTRQVYTFTEILTDDMVEQYVNDELVDQYPNSIGRIPVVHIPNSTISSSPWGQSDIWDIIPLNRELNEKMTEVSDIINYHACVDDQTEVLTSSGWKKHTDVVNGEGILTLNAETNAIQWQAATFNLFQYRGNLIKWDNHIDALTTPNHRWLTERRFGRNREYIREMSRTLEPGGGERSVPSLPQGSKIVLGGGVPTQFTTVQKFADEFVDLVGWWVTEGSIATLPSGSQVSYVHQSNKVNASYVDDIRRLALYWNAEGYTFTEQRERESGVVGWYLGTSLTEMLLSTCPDKSLPAEFLTNLTYHQAERLLNVLLAADGTKAGTRDTWYQNDNGRRDGFQMLSAMLGRRTRSYDNNLGHGVVDTYQKNTVLAEHTVERATEVAYDGTVWCPTVENGIWFARRNGVTFWTGNSPVTIITGAKANQLERGPKKVWAGLPKDASVFNLESSGEMAGALEYIQFLKRTMHEITGVPENALGLTQPISNTSGVALAIQYQPIMNRYMMKRIHFTKGLESINELVIRTAAVFMPEWLTYNPAMAAQPETDQLPQLNPLDPLTYQTEIHWPEPLPVDVLIKLNEVQAKMGMGLESKRGALRVLGEEFPNEKMSEIFEELRDDMIDQGALDMLRAQINQAVMLATGLIPGPDGNASVVSAGGANVTNTGDGGAPMPGTQVTGMEAGMVNNLVAKAYGARLAQRRVPDEE